MYHCGLIGEKLSHSYSKKIHEALYDCQYDLIELAPDRVKPFFDHFHYDGLNVTIPYKKTAYSLCGELSDRARSIGSVNTVTRPGGILAGDNTDYAGFSSLAEKNGISFQSKKVLILGTGGTSLTVQAVAKAEGASLLTVASRSGEVNYETLSLPDQPYQVIVNTTPVGMYPNNGKRLIDLDCFPHCCGVLDVIYNPLRTPLVCDALLRGLPAAGGLEMLVRQAAASAERFIGSGLDPARIDAVLQNLRRETENIVLIGMPGCGKSTVARILAEKTGRPCVDLDEVAAQKAGMSPEQIIRQQGEPAFRTLECIAAAETGKQTGLVIAAGGGTVLRQENRDALRQNGYVVWLDRPIGELDTQSRPLSSGGEDTLKRLYDERKKYYECCADVIVTVDRAASVTAERIKNSFEKNG